MSPKASCFVAYPSKPLSLAEIIEKAIVEIGNRKVVDIVGWKSTKTIGKFIMI